eukprot:m.31669 g.31669  ORF g.31669 m.31669 type:complete len:70 (+) comp14016_c0_seq1:621-830(+)
MPIDNHANSSDCITEQHAIASGILIHEDEILGVAIDATIRSAATAIDGGTVECNISYNDSTDECPPEMI